MLVLPAPFEPKNPTTSALLHAEGHLVDGHDGAELFGQPVDFEGGHQLPCRLVWVFMTTMVTGQRSLVVGRPAVFGHVGPRQGRTSDYVRTRIPGCDRAPATLPELP